MEYYRQVLKQDYEKRLAKNNAFSIRSYSRYLNIPQSTLLGVLNNKRDLPLRYVDLLINKMELAPSEKGLFEKSVRLSKQNLKEIGSVKIDNSDERVFDEQIDFDIISSWKYLAFLNLFKLTDNQFDPENFSKRLGISVQEVEKLKSDLLLREYIQERDGRYFRSNTKFSSTQDIKSKALKYAHLDILDLAKDKIDSVDIEDRFYSSTIFPVKKEKIVQAKKIIREFRDKLSDFLSDNPSDEVYNLSVQLFPLTENKE